MIDPSLPDYIGEIENNHDGHTFGEDLTCICRTVIGSKVINRATGSFSRYQYGPICGVAWTLHQYYPQPCVGKQTQWRKNETPNQKEDDDGNWRSTQTEL